MIEYVNIKDLTPAPYNPRRITQEQTEKLKQSIQKMGLIIPILVNKKNNVILAGHQRTKACKAIGVEKVPVIYVEDMVIGDEIKFNQIHNITDNSKKAKMTLEKQYEQEKFILIEHKDIKEGQTNAQVVKEICKLILKYGNVLSCVICKNQVLMGREYVKACKVLKLQINAYICNDCKYDLINEYFSQQYGEYYYGDLKKNTFVQGLAQMYRSQTKKDGKKANKSKLYETMVLPYLKDKRNLTVLDFGCGKGEYINNLSKRQTAIGIEFYNNNGKSINVTKGHKMIDDLTKFLEQNKKFDVVVCDSVINSVDSLKAEKSIYTLLNLFTRQKAFISGRTIDSVNSRANLKKNKEVGTRYIEFLDADNFTANYRQGQFYYQHYHQKDEIVKELKKYGFEVKKIQWQGTSFQIELDKVDELPIEQYIEAIDFEFNLPLPNDKTYQRQDDIKKALNLF